VSIKVPRHFLSPGFASYTKGPATIQYPAVGKETVFLSTDIVVGQTNEVPRQVGTAPRCTNISLVGCAVILDRPFETQINFDASPNCIIVQPNRCLERVLQGGSANSRIKFHCGMFPLLITDRSLMHVLKFLTCKGRSYWPSPGTAAGTSASNLSKICHNCQKPK
jgi:hypothetical protein